MDRPAVVEDEADRERGAVEAELPAQVAGLDRERAASLPNCGRTQRRIDGDVGNRTAWKAWPRVLPLAEADERAGTPTEPRPLE